jgi:group I intron endonuclease
MYGLVYKATNIIDGKIYVGQTIVGLKTRRECHVNAALAERDNNYFHNSIRKHGKDNFEWEIIDYASSKRELDDLEIYYIEELKSFEKGYNLTEGGGGMTNYVMTEEHRKNLSESHKGYKPTAEHCRKISEALMGHPVSECALQALAKYNKNRVILRGPDNPCYGRAPSKKVVDRLVEVVSCWWEVTFPDGTKEVLKNLSAFCKKHNFRRGALYSVSNGYRSHYKGYKCKKLTGQDNPNCGIKRSEETKRKMAIAKRGKNNSTARAVIINNKYFDTVKEAAAFLKITYQTVGYRIRRQWPDYHYA